MAPILNIASFQCCVSQSLLASEYIPYSKQYNLNGHSAKMIVDAFAYCDPPTNGVVLHAGVPPGPEVDYFGLIRIPVPIAAETGRNPVRQLYSNVPPYTALDRVDTSEG